MLYLDQSPLLIETKVFSAVPDQFRRKGIRLTWADANRPGQPTDCFIEGPSFDADGNLYIVDIPFGRVFRIAPDGAWATRSALPRITLRSIRATRLEIHS